MPNRHWNVHRSVGVLVGCLIWFGTVSLRSAIAARRHRSPMLYTSRAIVMSKMTASILAGLFRKNDEVKK